MSVHTMYGARLTGQAALDVLMEAVERLAGAQDELAVAAILRTAARRLTGADGISIVLKRNDRVHFFEGRSLTPEKLPGYVEGETLRV
jgi:succinate dehydrogenase/fumarate reductase flavoprotein subunit